MFVIWIIHMALQMTVLEIKNGKKKKKLVVFLYYRFNEEFEEGKEYFSCSFEILSSCYSCESLLRSMSLFVNK